MKQQPKIHETMNEFPESAQKHLQKHLDDFLSSINVIFNMFPDLCGQGRIYRTSDHYGYENDGNTTCDGTKYEVYAMIPIGREFMDKNQELASYRNGNGDCCLCFHSEIILRDSDHKRVNDMCESHISPYVFDFNKRNTIRLSTSVKIEDRNLVRLVQEIKKIFELQQLEKEIATFSHVVDPQY